MYTYGVYRQNSNCVFNTENSLCGGITPYEPKDLTDAIRFCKENDVDGLFKNGVGGDEREFHYIPVVLFEEHWYEVSSDGHPFSSDYFGKEIKNVDGHWVYSDGMSYDNESYYLPYGAINV